MGGYGDGSYSLPELACEVAEEEGKGLLRIPPLEPPWHRYRSYLTCCPLDRPGDGNDSAEASLW
jgi:hypothetical protein